jgi:hypothetical protein
VSRQSSTLISVDDELQSNMDPLSNIGVLSNMELLSNEAAEWSVEKCDTCGVNSEYVAIRFSSDVLQKQKDIRYDYAGYV